MSMWKFALLAAASLWSVAAMATQLYTWTDDNGVVHYSDKPVLGAQPAVISDNNNVVPRLNEGSLPTTQTTGKSQGFKLAIRTPANQETIRDNLGRLSINGSSEPQEIPQGYSYRLLLNGQIVNQGAGSPDFTLTNVNRGEHKMKIELVDPTGKIIASSPVSVVYLHRTSQSAGGR